VLPSAYRRERNRLSATDAWRRAAVGDGDQRISNRKGP